MPPGSRHEDEAEVPVAGAAEALLSAHILALLNHLAGLQGSPRRGVRAGEWGSPEWRVPGQMGLLGPGLLITHSLVSCSSNSSRPPQNLPHCVPGPSQPRTLERNKQVRRKEEPLLGEGAEPGRLYRGGGFSTTLGLTLLFCEMGLLYY